MFNLNLKNMKTTQFKSLAALYILLILSSASHILAQHGQMNGPKQGPGFKSNIPDLTEEQQKKLSDLGLEHQKNMLQFRNQMDVKNAQLNLLSTADKADMNAINKTIDEIGTLKTQMMKERENHHQQVRSLLTEKQRVIFDTQRGNKHRGDFDKGNMRMNGFRGKGNSPKETK
jgi:Spy/CpxP family protein refolding chaperone